MFQHFLATAILGIFLSGCLMTNTDQFAVIPSLSKIEILEEADGPLSLTTQTVEFSSLTPHPGQTLTVTHKIRANVAAEDITLQFDLRRVTDTNGIPTKSLDSKTFTGEDFARRETRTFSFGFAVPAGAQLGDYVYVVKATSSDGATTYIETPAVTTANKVALTASTSIKSYMRGINIMDIGNAGGSIPGVFGTNYTRPSLASLQALKARGIDVVRLPFLWDRMQRTMNGPLQEPYLEILLSTLRDANTAGLKTIIDMHNYGRFNFGTSGSPDVRTIGSDTGPTIANYVDVWQKIALRVKADAQAYAAIYAYDLMNEPYGLPSNPGTLADAISASDFATTTEGWTSEYNPGGSTLVQTTRGSEKSIMLTTPAVAGNSNIFMRALRTDKLYSKSVGRVLQFKGFVPADSPASEVMVKVIMYDSTGAARSSSSVAVEKGKQFTLFFTPPDANYNDLYGSFVLQFFLKNNTGAAPNVVYLDDIQQGSAISGALTSAQVWEKYAQAAVDGIRSLNDNTLIMVEGYEFSSAKNWPTNHPTPFINDPHDNIMYHAHMYFDGGGGGAYTDSHATELADAITAGFATVGQRSIHEAKQFADWLDTHKVRGFMGEYGWPNSAVVGTSDANLWNADGEEYLNYLDTRKLGACMWATGSWLSPTDNILNAYQLKTVFTPLSQASVLEAHPGR